MKKNKFNEKFKIETLKNVYRKKLKFVKFFFYNFETRNNHEEVRNNHEKYHEFQ